MNAADIRNVIRLYVERRVLEPDLRDDRDIFADGLINSLFAVELVAFIEQEFDVTVENEDMDLSNFASIDALVNFVERKKASA